MGTSSSKRESLLKAEQDLLDWGLKWFNKTVDYSGEGKSLNVNSYDVNVTVPHHYKKDKDYEGHIHTVECSQQADGISNKEHAPLVLLHGYGNGLGNFYSVLPGLANNFDGRVYAIDMFGCGLSSRPVWKLGYGENVEVSKAESFFLDAFEAWRKAQKIEKMVLLGHSLGGYLSVAYSERYPERVEKLILCSPVGLPEKPTQTYKSRDVPLFYRTIVYLWGKGWSPYHVVRWTGSRLVDAYTERRFSRDASWINKDLLKSYMYHNWTSGNISGGGYAHATILQPGAYARKPLHSRLKDIATSVPEISFIYGTHDWMDVRHAERIRDSHVPIDTESDQIPNISIIQVWNGGHNMFDDNPLGFVDAVCNAVNEDVISRNTLIVGDSYVYS